MKPWRPKNWENPFKSVSEGGHLESPTGASIFEAGADAILEALRKIAKRENSHAPYKQITTNGIELIREDISGVWVFIPDENEE